jgi:hypothetical protein
LLVWTASRNAVDYWAKTAEEETSFGFGQGPSLAFAIRCLGRRNKEGEIETALNPLLPGAVGIVLIWKRNVVVPGRRRHARKTVPKVPILATALNRLA